MTPRWSFWPSLIASVLMHGGLVALALAAGFGELTPARPASVVVGVVSLASAPASASARKDATPEPLPEPKKVEERKLEPEAPKIEAPEPPPVPEAKKIEEKKTEASSATTQTAAPSTASIGAKTDFLPEPSPTNPAPPYPEEAMRKGWQGRVVLRVLVLRDGKVGAISVHRTSGHPALDQAALETVKSRWQFIAGRRGDVPIDHEIGVPVTFELRSKNEAK